MRVVWQSAAMTSARLFAVSGGVVAVVGEVAPVKRLPVVFDFDRILVAHRGVNLVDTTEEQSHPCSGQS